MTSLSKLRPDRDLQCYFQQPSAIAALSATSDVGFTVSGSWRQQFDWAVVEWNRDNIFEHPALRNLPDGNLSGLTLQYEERRANCIEIDSTGYDSLGWSYLRIWENSGDSERVHWVPLLPHAVPLDEYTDPTVQFELQGAVTVDDIVELSWLDHHFNCQVATGETLVSVVERLAATINAAESTAKVHAVANGAKVDLRYHGAPGSNGNRIGVYGGINGAQTESWSPEWGLFAGGRSPERWQITLDFAHLEDADRLVVPTSNVRKMRWTWAAAPQTGDYQRCEFQVEVANWQVTGSGLKYSVAGPGSRRIEDHSADVRFSGEWREERGNYSGGSTRYSVKAGDSADCCYAAPATHELYLGTRYLGTGGQATVIVDNVERCRVELLRPLEDTLVRVRIGEFAGDTPHVVTVRHTGTDGSRVYFDFLEIALPTQSLPLFDADSLTTLATDWDTDHSLALAPERTAWLITQMGFHGRANHYAGAMWFYELHCRSNRYASATVEFGGSAAFGYSVSLSLSGSTISHLILVTDTPERIAKCFELLINAGSSAVWAQAEGIALKITARQMGLAGDAVSLAAATNCPTLSISTSGPKLQGGEAGTWVTDLAATPKLNRAVRDWSRSYFRALQQAGIRSTAAFSMELRHGDDSLGAGIAQRYPSGPAWLNTPALQTNFGPQSQSYWREVYVEMAQTMSEAGVRPFLQFGEVQWWYFADASGMPFYDEYTKAQFQAEYGRGLATIPNQLADPSLFQQECEFLPRLIGEFTTSIMNHVRQTVPDTEFEVLYPPDTNDTPLNRAINFPHSAWTPSTLACLKTENFTYTGDRNLDKARSSISLPGECGFPASQRSHLIGISDPTAPWAKELDLCRAQGVESIVLFALDQFCLIGYGIPVAQENRWSQYMGG